MPLFSALTSVINMQQTSNSSSTVGQVWFDGTHLYMNIGSTIYQMDHTPVGSQFTVSNITPNFIFNGSTATNSTLINTIGTIIQVLQGSNL